MKKPNTADIGNAPVACDDDADSRTDFTAFIPQ